MKDFNTKTGAALHKGSPCSGVEMFASEVWRDETTASLYLPRPRSGSAFSAFTFFSVGTNIRS